MESRFTKSTWLIAFFCLAALALHAQGSTLKAQKVTVDGTSSLHDWTSSVNKVDWKGTVKTEGGKLKEVKDVTITIAVTSIKSTKGKTMDNKTYEAFKSDKNPNITYKLSEATVSGNNVTAKGTLTMAGASKPITLNVVGKVLAGGDVQFTGSQKLNMTEFKMDPPTAVMGTIKVGPEVTVKIDITVTSTK